MLIAALTAVYIAAGKIGLGYGLLHPSASAVWPPTGVAIAALLVFGRSVWPAIFVGAFLVNATTEGSIVTSLAIAAGNTLEGLAAAYLAERFARGTRAFEHANTIVKFAAGAALASSTLSATIGVGALTLGGYADQAQFGAIWLTWWLGDVAGAIIVTPLLVLWYRDRSLRAPWRRAVEAALLFATVILATALLFFHPLLNEYPLSFFAIPPLVWAAFRFGQREVATAVAAMSSIATFATATNHGPLVMMTPNESLLVLQAFMAMVAMTALVIAALARELGASVQRERAALAEAEASLRSSDTFFAMLSHELRNPLSAIAAASALLELSPSLDGPAGRARDIIKRQTTHLTRLIEDLLDVARITAGKLTLHRRRVNLAEITEAAVQSLVSPDRGRAAQVKLDLEPVMVDADPDRLDQIVVNLVHNSLKYTPPDGAIKVRTWVDGDDALLGVDDTGSGIAPELLPRVFDIFTQSTQGPDRAQGGLGIGLTLVRRLAELHDGRVEAHSDGAGRGSRFVVRFPRAPERRAPDVRPAVPPGSRHYRILIVEDIADAREPLRLLLESAGHAVLEAGDGPSAVQVASEEKPDFALVDLGLPGFDGYEVARRVRAAGVATRLIALTGYGRDEDRARSREAGFDAHLVKPVTLERLQEVLETLSTTDPD